MNREPETLNLDEIKERALELGFQDVGYWRFEEMEEESERLEQWLECGNHATMKYLERNKAVARDPRREYSWATGALVFVFRWDLLHASAQPLWAPWTAAYARGRDYHEQFRSRAAAFTDSFPWMRTSAAVDATPLQERAIARRAGLGWIGKNRYLIHEKHGGNVGLGELVVDRDFGNTGEESPSVLCGDCRLCVEACPTGALTTEGITSRVCLSYLTGEFRGTIPQEMRSAIGIRILGCDTCLSVCPYGMLPSPPEPREIHVSFLKEALRVRSNREFTRRFEGSAFLRLGRKATLRNVAVACGNLGREDLIPCLEDALSNDPASIVREHAAWALGRIGGQTARRVLERQRGGNTTGRP
jgi:epoxyqueuosine reductase